ncbi:hypothetical protein [Caballeronia catudaia]|uniref:hypothetical protein n=1 Tax=Caballeronia catudaia TaxID=1777136 RepID=UPI002E108991
MTAARSGEVRGATWSEFDLDAGIWAVPAERMKAKEVHRVALSALSLALVNRLKEQKLHEALVFPHLAERFAATWFSRRSCGA